jgi:hypothetical protein
MIHDMINAAFLETMFNLYPTGGGYLHFSASFMENILYEQKKIKL